MYWQEDELNQENYQVSDDVVDLAFSIQCDSLPVDHAYSLSSAICAFLPWFAEEQIAALHLIHGADSGNGWARPEQAGDLIYLSRRTKLTLRLPKERLEDAMAMCGAVLDVGGCLMTINDAKPRPLSSNHTLYARHLVDEGEDEELFIRRYADELRQLRLRFKKILAGRPHTLETPDGPLPTRSLMVAELPPDDAVYLQQQGLGLHQKIGCGVFIAHKTISS